MAAKRKAVAGTLGKTASNNQSNSTLSLQENQQASQTENPLHLTRSWIASLLLSMACWEMLFAALAVLFLGGLAHA